MVMAGAGGGNYQFDVGLRWLGAGPGGGTEGAAASPRIPGNLDQIKREKDKAENLKKMSKTGMQHMRSTFGINIGIAAILKQSQIFTGTIGTLFQILGAFIDVILASFMPIIIPALMLMAKLIPYIRKAADNIVGNLIRFFAWAKGHIDSLGNLIPDKIKNWFSGFFKTVIAHFLVITFLSKIFGFSRIWFGLWKMVLIRPLLTVLGAILAATIFRGGGIGGLGRGGAKTGQGIGGLYSSSKTPIAAAGGASRFARFGSMGARLAPIAGRVGLGTLAAGAGIAYEGYQGVQNVRKKNYWGAGGAVAGGVGGGGIGMALGGPMGAAIGVSLGMMAGRMLGDALGKKLAENQAGQAANNSYRSGNQTNAPDYNAGTPPMSGAQTWDSYTYRGIAENPSRSEFRTGG